MAGTLRITGGKLVRRRFDVPEDADNNLVRPATDKIREAVFSSLNSYLDLENARVLDLFAGSGAYCFESLSRYASHATLIDLNKRILETAKNNSKKLEIFEKCEFILQDSNKWLENRSGMTGEGFDLIFLDPPFKDILELEYFEKLANILAKDGLIVFRCEKKAKLNIPKQYEITREKIYGSSRVIFLENQR